MPLLDNLKDSKYMYENEQKFIQSVKRVPRQTNLLSGPVEAPKLKFEHKDEFGQSWEQDYQYVQFATSIGEIMRVSYAIQVQIEIETLMARQVKDITIPI